MKTKKHYAINRPLLVRRLMALGSASLGTFLVYKLVNIGLEMGNVFIGMLISFMGVLVFIVLLGLAMLILEPVDMVDTELDDVLCCKPGDKCLCGKDDPDDGDEDIRI